MPLGRLIRARLGRYERPVADAYRALFLDLGHVVDLVAEGGAPGRVLEVGCGEGALASRLTRRFPGVEYVGLDVADNTGRLFDGDARRARFHRTTVEAFAAAEPAPFDLVLVCDVLHHVPAPDRPSLLRASGALVAPGGTFVLKDWERRRDLPTAAAAASDRYLTGDRHVRYFALGELRAYAELAAGAGSVWREARVRPWRNNVALFARPHAA